MSQIRGFILIYQAIFTPHEIPDKKHVRKMALFIGLFVFVLFSLFSITTYLELRHIKTASWDLKKQELTVNVPLPNLNGPLHDAKLSGILHLNDAILYKKDGKLTRILIPFTHSTWKHGEQVNILIRYDIDFFNRTAPAFNMLKDMGLSGPISDAIPFIGVFEFISNIAQSEKDELNRHNHNVSDHGLYVSYVQNNNIARYENAVRLKTKIVVMELQIGLGFLAFFLFVRWRLRAPNDKIRRI